MTDPVTTTERRRLVIGFIALSYFATQSMAGCRDSFRRELDDGFPNGIGTAGDPEGSFRAAMSRYHVSTHDIDCMVSEAFADLSAAERSKQFNWSAEQLDGFAATCGVDFSKLWYTAD